MNDAAFGAGVYLTKLGPEASRYQVAINNYDGQSEQFWKKQIIRGKTDVIISLKLRSADVKRCRAGSRDVYLYKGDLRLAEAKYVVFYERGRNGIKHYFYNNDNDTESCDYETDDETDDDSDDDSDDDY